MKQVLFAMFSACLIAGGYAMYIQQDTGSLQVKFAAYHFETDLLNVGIASLIFVVALLILSSLYSLLKKLAGLFGSKRAARLANQARLSLEHGLIELAEGRFEKAEKLFLHKITHNENALLCYLSAARAAQKQGAHDRRDEYLRKAHESTPTADIAIGLTQAELQYSHGQFEQALATLNNLHTLSPKHAYVLYLLAKTHGKLREWDKLRNLVPELHKLNIFPPEKLLPLEIATWSGLYAMSADKSGFSQLTQNWKDTPKHLKGLPDIVETYAKQLISIKCEGEAEQILRDHLSNSWDESTVILYSEINVLADNKQLETAQDWLLQHQHNPYLLFTLGKMCLLRSLWGKARNYLEASLSIKPMPQTFLLLATLLEENMNESSLAQRYYKQGLLLLGEECGVDSCEDTTNLTSKAQPPSLKVIQTT